MAVAVTRPHHRLDYEIFRDRILELNSISIPRNHRLPMRFRKFFHMLRLLSYFCLLRGREIKRKTPKDLAMALIVFLNMSCCLWWPDFSNSCWLRNHPNGEGGGNATHTNHTTHQHPLISAHVWVCAGRKQLVDTFTVQ